MFDPMDHAGTAETTGTADLELDQCGAYSLATDRFGQLPGVELFAHSVGGAGAPWATGVGGHNSASTYSGKRWNIHYFNKLLVADGGRAAPVRWFVPA
jgi:hypothetical protein